jgi:hypothetical protein
VNVSAKSTAFEIGVFMVNPKVLASKLTIIGSNNLKM